jgi:hypothetical protein
MKLLGFVVRACNPSTLETKAGGSQVLGSLGFSVRLSQQNKTEKQLVKQKLNIELGKCYIL